jgi:DNA-binding NarL/FixJ family response regulator
MIRILIADDHAVVRRGLTSIIALTPDIEVTGTANNGWEALNLSRELAPDLILTDLSMPGPGGMQVVERLRAEVPRIPILVFSMHSESQYALRSIKAGAAGYLTKGCEPDILLAAIRRCAAGGHYIEAEIASQLVFSTVADSATDTGDVSHHGLSKRELEILLMLARGVCINSVADKLCISSKTVSTHKLRLMRKLGANSLADLVRYAIRAGLTEA